MKRSIPLVLISLCFLNHSFGAQAQRSQQHQEDKTMRIKAPSIAVARMGSLNPTSPFRSTFTLTPTQGGQEEKVLRSICKRIFLIKDDKVVVPDLSDCNEDIFFAIAKIGGVDRVVSVVSQSGTILRPNLLRGVQMSGVTFKNVKFLSYSLKGNNIDKNDGRRLTGVEVSCYYLMNSPGEWAIVVKIDDAYWSGYVDLNKEPFDISSPIDKQKQSQLKAGDQFK
jgi:hypothetical protein